MLSSKDLEKMQNMLTCSICKDLVTKASVTPCSHIFCNFCLTQHLGNTGKCAVCKHPVTKRSVSVLDNLDQIVEEFKNLKSKVHDMYTPRKLLYNGNVDFEGLKFPLKRLRPDDSDIDDHLLEEKLTEVRRLIEKRKKGVLLIDSLLDDVQKNGSGALDMDYHPILECIFPFDFLQVLRRRKRRKLDDDYEEDEFSDSEDEQVKKRGGGRKGKKSRMVICSSGLDKLEIIQAKKATKIIGGRFVNSPTPSVTHLVVKTDFQPKKRFLPVRKPRCKRTKKYCCAVLQGAWVVSFGWVEHILREKCEVLETFYEVWGDTQSGDERSPVQLGRIAAMCGDEALFQDLTVFGFNLTSRGHLDLVKSLVNYGGGTFLDGLPVSDYSNSQNDGKVVICIDENVSEEEKGIAEKKGYTLVQIGFFLDSISEYQMEEI